MIQRRLDEFLKEKGVSRYRLSMQTGISQGNLKKLAKGETTGIEFSVLERICKELNCQPGDLLIFVKEDSERKQ